MPELPEVEAVRRVMRDALQDRRITRVEVPPDEIVLGAAPPEAFVEALTGSRVEGVGRKGKYWWLELDRRPWVFGHLGMSGWVRELGEPTIRLREHGKAPFDDEDGRPRFLKLLIETEEGRRIAFTDGRRLGRLWLGEGPASDPRIRELGFDCFEELPEAKVLAPLLARRKAPIKAVLLDQGLFAGVGNWIADEVLYQARIAPKRLAASLSLAEIKRLREALRNVLEVAVSVNADKEQFPEDWLFAHRWGGDRGVEMIGGKRIVRESVGGRTTAWVPGRQK